MIMAEQSNATAVTEASHVKKGKRPFSFKDEFGYILGDMGGSFVNLYIDAFFLTFATYVLGINPLFMGNLFLFARLFDAVNDPIIGSLPDRWKLGKSGDKFKPYIKIAMWPLALSVIFAFADVSAWGSTLKHVWVVFAYVLYGISYTGTSMPFGAMANVVTDNPIERTKLSRARSIGGALVGAVFLSIIPLFIWDDAGQAVPKAFFIIAIFFALFSVLSYLGLLKLTEERIVEDEQDEDVGNFEYTKVLKDVFKNRPLVGVMLATVGSLIFITASGQLGSIMFLEYYRMPQLQSIAQLSQVVVLIICLPLIPKLAEKFGKQKTLLVAVALNAVIAAFLFFVPIANPYVFIVLFIIGNIGQTIFAMLIWALVSDSLDYHEYKFNYRSDGSLYSIYTFSRKIGSTIASTLAGYSLAWIGFVAGAAAQSADVSGNIRLLFTAVPLVASILELIGIGLVFNLTKDKTNEMYATLAERRKK